MLRSRKFGCDDECDHFMQCLVEANEKFFYQILLPCSNSARCIWICWSCRLTHFGLVTPYGDRDLGHHWLRKWLVAWRHQAITWTIVDLWSLRSSDVHLRAISLEISKPSVTKISLKIIFLRFYWNLPGANELKESPPAYLSGLWEMW